MSRSVRGAPGVKMRVPGKRTIPVRARAANTRPGSSSRKSAACPTIRAYRYCDPVVSWATSPSAVT